jgi:hypothetical protein
MKKFVYIFLIFSTVLSCEDKTENGIPIGIIDYDTIKDIIDINGACCQDLNIVIRKQNELDSLYATMCLPHDDLNHRLSNDSTIVFIDNISEYSIDNFDFNQRSLFCFALSIGSMEQPAISKYLLYDSVKDYYIYEINVNAIQKYLGEDSTSKILTPFVYKSCNWISSPKISDNATVDFNINIQNDYEKYEK